MPNIVNQSYLELITSRLRRQGVLNLCFLLECKNDFTNIFRIFHSFQMLCEVHNSAKFAGRN